MKMIAITAQLVIVLIWCVRSLAGYGQISMCLNSPTKLNIDCPVTNMIQILEVFHGHSAVGNCSYTTGDCKKTQTDNYHCAGRQTCTIDVATEVDGIWLPGCRQQSNYLQVTYKCVPVNQVHNVCDNGTMTQQSGYISSPNYPSSYGPALSCHLTVKVNPGQTIKFDIVDMNLRDSNYMDCLMLSDHIRSHTWCNKLSNQRVFTSRGNTAKVDFSTDKQDNAKGFWVYYEAVPLIEDNTGTTKSRVTPSLKQTTKSTAVKISTTIPTVKPVAKQPTTKTNQMNEPQQEASQPATTQTDSRRGSQAGNGQKGTSLPVGAIIGLVLGSLILIMLALLVLLVVRRYRERRRRRSESLNMIFT